MEVGLKRHTLGPIDASFLSFSHRSNVLYVDVVRLAGGQSRRLPDDTDARYVSRLFWKLPAPAATFSVKPVLGRGEGLT